MEYQFTSLATITYIVELINDTNVGGYTNVGTLDAASNTYLQASAGDTSDDGYGAMWSDPTDDMIAMAHELTLRTAIATTNKLVVVRKNASFECGTEPCLLTQDQPEIGWPNLTLVNRTTDRMRKSQ
jgi:hypothetical protein